MRLPQPVRVSAPMSTRSELDWKLLVAAVEFYRSAHRLSHLPIPPALDRAAANLQTLMAANGQGSVAPQQEWLTTDQIAERLHCSERTARRKAAEVGKKIRRQWMAPADALPTTED
jgi:AraC-like DNA-binding protein